jgi:hypothetical protein
MTNYYRPLMTLGYLISATNSFGPMAYGFHLANVVLNAGGGLPGFPGHRTDFHNRALGFVSAVIFASASGPQRVSGLDRRCDRPSAHVFLPAHLLAVPAGSYPRLAPPLRAGAGSPAPLLTKSRGGAAELGMVLSFTLALLAKEPAATVPFLATFYEHFLRDDRGRTTLRQKLSRYLSLWLVDAAYLLFRTHIFGGLAPVLQLPQISRREAFYSSFRADRAIRLEDRLAGQSLRVLPFPQKSLPLRPSSPSGGLVLWDCACARSFTPGKGSALSRFGLLWFFLNLAPVLNGRWLGANVFTERYLYLPSLGFCWIAAWGGRRLWMRLAGRPTARKFYAAGLATVAVLCVVRIVTRTASGMMTRPFTGARWRRSRTPSRFGSIWARFTGIWVPGSSRGGVARGAPPSPQSLVDSEQPGSCLCQEETI